MRFLFNVFFVVFIALVVAFDLRQRKIPNLLVSIGIVAGLFFNVGAGWPQLFDSFLGFGLGLGILIVPFAFGWLGAGDVKFFAAVGALLGVKCLPRVFFYSALVGGMLAFVSIALQEAFSISRLWCDLKLFAVSGGSLVPGPTKQGKTRSVPYGVAIGTGALIAFYLDPIGEWAGF